VLLVAGVAVQVVCCLGMAVMRDAFDRLHLVGAAGFGTALVCCAVVVRESFSLIGDKALAIAVLVLLTGPVLVHVTARALRVRLHGRWEPFPGEMDGR
jgi:multisubunit Na+/H+ antiporter MnhG subunit